jgi:Tfp pilus assembly protein PilF
MPRKTPRKTLASTAAAPERVSRWHFWKPWYLLACAVAVALIVYWPALRGTFIFDDFNLPFADRNAAVMPTSAWIGGVRPILMVTYWGNYLMSGTETVSYHVVNVMLHAATAVLLFFIFERMFSIAGGIRKARGCALAGAAIFLLHPLQTEPVDYIAGRSEIVSGLLFCAAWLIYLRAFESETGIVTSIEILLLGGAAVLAKENAICLPAVLLATDFFWARRPFASQMRRRVKLYLPFAIGAVLASVWILRRLTAGTAAGFSSGASPAQYALTESRVILTYIRLFFVPVGQNGDWELPFFRSLADSGAWFYVLILLALIAGAVWLFKRLRLVSFGLVIFLLMLTPTSSVVPIKDALAERRMYMPITGLIIASIALLIAIADRRHWKPRHLQAVAAVTVVTAACLSWQRSFVWTGPVAFWSDAALKNPANARAHLGLGSALLVQHDCKPAVREFTIAKEEDPANTGTTWNLAEALQCAGQPARALPLLQSFASSKPSAEAWNQVAYTEATLGRPDEVFTAIDKALSLDPNNATSYAYRGLARFALNNLAGAREDFAHALQLDPQNTAALDGSLQLDRLQGK